jgi:DNA-binding SARP family transcriptional activator
MTKVQFQLLGPFRVVGATGEQVTLERRRDRCLLALLLLEPGKVIQTDRLVELLWDDDPPEMARRAVQAHVARLRSAMASAFGQPLIARSGAGYVIKVDPHSVDVHRFMAMVDDVERSSAPVTECAQALREALALWSGPMLADVASPRLRDRICRGFEELRAATLENWLRAELELGRHRERMPDFARAHAEHPDRQNLAGLYMLALHRCGRTATASDVFAEFHHRLAESTGLEPAAQLRDLHVRILRNDPSLNAPAESRPLPVEHLVESGVVSVPVEHFFGREAQLALLDTVCCGSGPRIAALHGPGGVGKTTLAMRWAAMSAAKFSDGIHYFDFRSLGHISSPEAAADLVLASLGLIARTEQYRHAVRGRRLLVLDNVPDAALVRALVPADPETMVIAISRHALDGLVIRDRAVPVQLSNLDIPEAVELLASAARADPADPRLVPLAEFCDGLPLALRIAGCRAANQGAGGLELLLQDLRQEERRLTALEIDDQDAGVRAIFDESYRGLEETHARLFRLIGLLPGVIVDVPSASCLMEASTSRAYQLLTSLARNQLLMRDARGGYRMHDLTRLYAQECALRDEKAAERDNAIRRVADWYLDTTFAAYSLLSPRRASSSPPEIRFPPLEPTRFESREHAITWFESERPGLSAMVRELATRQWHRAAWQLAASLFAFYHQRRLWADWIEVYLCALESVAIDGDPLGMVRICNGLGVANKQLGRYETALDFYRRALEAARPLGDPLTIGPVYANLGGIYNTIGEIDLAREHLSAGLALPGYGDSPSYAPVLLLNLGHLEYNQRRYDESAAYMQRGLKLSEISGDAHTTAYLHHGLGEVSFQRNMFGLAASHAEEELRLAKELRDPLRQAYALDLLASARAKSGDGGAEALWREALAIAEEIGHGLAASIAELLRDPPADLAERRFEVNRLP